MAATNMYAIIWCLVCISIAGVSSDTCEGYTSYGIYYEGFECPTLLYTEDETYCCGDDSYRYCCDQSAFDFGNDLDDAVDTAVGLATAVIIGIICGVIALVVLIIVCIVVCVYCCIKGATSSSQATTTVVHQTAPAPAYSNAPPPNYSEPGKGPSYAV
ncbi:uncharacterized protein LOC100373098 [Saccoglossus kowalevskii]|uniref:Protein shisa-3 homolog n=1 Tax=Saccoglossus kowalevskii TaxID=10224 RepID=A0ABM0LWR3_SACKO|nr:PREDICTED: protein shisa-3 homolog [Saccoglossus kowalevskii]